VPKATRSIYQQFSNGGSTASGKPDVTTWYKKTLKTFLKLCINFLICLPTDYGPALLQGT